MPTPLRVLIVEDRPTDAELMVHELRRAGFDPDWRCVETEPEFLAELSRTTNVILADHNLPQFSALRALELLKKSTLDIPLIVVTGSISEEAAVERIKQGAADYILKDRMTRLGEAVKRALEEKKLRDEKQQATVDLQARYKELQVLQEISATILASSHLDATLGNILDKTLALGSFDLGVIRLLDPATDILEPVAGRGYHNQENFSGHRKKVRERPGGPFLIPEMQHKEPRVEENLPQCDDLRTMQREGIESVIILPVRTEDDVLGILQLGSRTRRKFDPNEIRLFESIGFQAGIAIQKARLYEQTKRNLERIRALHEIDIAITSTLDLHTVLDILLEKIEIFLPYPAATTVRLINRETGVLEPLACRGLNEEEWRAQDNRALGGRAKKVFETKTFLIARNVQTDSQTSNPEIFHRYGLVSHLAAPLIARNETMGVLGFYTKEEHEFTNEEIDFLNTLAGQAAIAIHNARLYEETERRSREAEELARVARSLTETLDIAAVGERIVTSVRELFGVKGATLRLLRPDGSLRALASSGEVFSQSPAGDTLSHGTGVTARAVAEGRPIWSADVLNDPAIRLSDWMRDYQLRSGNRSIIAVPSRAHEKLIGVLTLSGRTGRTYSDREISLLQTFADQGAVALENAQLYAQTERQLKRIEALREIDEAITSTLSLSDVLEILLQRIESFCPFAVSTGVRLLDKERGQLVPIAARNIPLQEWKAEIAKGRGLLTIQIARMKTPVAISNMFTDPRTSLTNFARKHGLVSYLGIPLTAKDEFIGTLVIYSKEEHEFSAEEVEFFTTLGSQAAIAIHNAQLFEEIGLSKAELEKTTRYLERSLKQLGGLYTALTPIVAGGSTQEMMGEIIERLIEATGADAALIRVWDDKTRTVPIIGYRGFSDDYVRRVGPAPASGAVAWVVTHSDPIIAADIAMEPRLKGKLQLQLGLRSCAMLPLNVHGAVRGILHIASRKLGYFDEEQRDHLVAIARQMSIALENRELFDNLNELYDTLRKKVEELQQKTAELERANKAKSNFLSVISHELRTPLNIIMGYTVLLADETLGAIESGQRDALKRIQHQSSELLMMVDRVLDATLLETEEPGIANDRLNLGTFLEEVTVNCAIHVQRQIELEWDYPTDLPRIRTDTRKLKNILENLVHNAIKFTKQGKVMIAVRVVAAGDNCALAPESAGFPTPARELTSDTWLEFKVSDTGVGIPDNLLPLIFDRFYQVDSSATREYGGMGLGLYIVKRFTELLGGSIKAQSTLAKGSTFTVRIPVAPSQP